MKPRIAAALAAALLVPTSAVQAARPFEVRDSIQIANFLEEPVFSPDGRHFVTVTHHHYSDKQNW